MSKEEINKMAELFEVLSDSTRIRIIWMLNEENCVSQIAEELHMTQSAISHQLRVLRVNNLVQKRRKGKQIYYKVNDEHVGRILKIGMEHVNEKSRI